MRNTNKVEPISISSVCLQNMAIAEIAVMQGGSPLATESILTIMSYRSMMIYVFELRSQSIFFIFMHKKEESL